jgi:hypothetical protein
MYFYLSRLLTAPLLALVLLGIARGSAQAGDMLIP